MRMVVFVVLMCLWLFGGGFIAYGAQQAVNPVAFGVVTLLPWLCVAILGWEIYRGGAGPVVYPYPEAYPPHQPRP
jgi:hypothetical protein